MTISTFTRTTLTSIGLASAAMVVPSIAVAQGFTPTLPDAERLSIEEARSLPLELQTAPIQAEPRNYLPDAQTSIGPDGVETITRTRRIARRTIAAPTAVQGTAGYVTEEEYEVELPALPQTGGGYAPHAQSYGQHASYGYAPTYAPAYSGAYSGAYSPGAQVFQREEWIAECERRTNGHRGRKKGGIIGGLLGAVAGGIIGNRAFDSERLGGTLLGAGVGGLGGALLGSLLGGGRNDRGEYDCAAALDAYQSQYAAGGHRVAVRTIPAPAYAAPAYAPVYQHSYAAPQQYYYAPPQQITYVPIEYQQRQRVIVRETVREEVIPGARRAIPAPAPVVRPAPAPVARPVPAPRLIKGGEPRYIKGN